MVLVPERTIVGLLLIFTIKSAEVEGQGVALTVQVYVPAVDVAGLNIFETVFPIASVQIPLVAGFPPNYNSMSNAVASAQKVVVALFPAEEA